MIAMTRPDDIEAERKHAQIASNLRSLGADRVPGDPRWEEKTWLAIRTDQRRRTVASVIIGLAIAFALAYLTGCSSSDRPPTVSPCGGYSGWFVLGACLLTNGFQWLVRYVWARIDLILPWGSGGGGRGGGL